MRFLTYSHDSCGLGHLRRTLVIGKHLAENVPDASVLSLIGSTAAQNFFSSESRNHDYIKLPCVQKFGEGEYRARHLSLGIDELFGMRRALIAETVRVFQPDVVIVDKNPQGLGGELVPALEAMRRGPKPARIILGLRDILDDPSVVTEEWRNREFTRWVERIYDGIWIWGEEDVFDAASAYQFPEGIRERTKYMGYLPPSPARDSSERIRARAGIQSGTERLALLTFGGGGDALPKVLGALEGLARAEEKLVRATVIAGPLMSEEDFRRVQVAARSIEPRVHVLRFVTNLDDWIRASDAVICMGGYNTLCEVAAIGKPALVLPRMHPRLEQSLRARRFATHGWCEFVDDETQTASRSTDFFHRLAAGRLSHSLVPLPCRALESLSDEATNWNGARSNAALRACGGNA